MNLPWQRAKDAFERKAGGKSFESLLGNYLAQGGYVWSSPTEFILAVPAVVREGEVLHTDQEPDTWYIALAAAVPGHSFIRRFLSLAPYPLPRVAWERRGGKLRVYPWTAWEDRKDTHGSQH